MCLKHFLQKQTNLAKARRRLGIERLGGKDWMGGTTDFQPSKDH